MRKKKFILNSEVRILRELKEQSTLSRNKSGEKLKNILKMNNELGSNEEEDQSVSKSEIHFKRRKKNYNNQVNKESENINLDSDKTVEYSKNMMSPYPNINIFNNSYENILDIKLFESDKEMSISNELKKYSFENKNLNILETVHVESLEVCGLHQYGASNDNKKEILIIDDHVYIRETLKNLIRKILVNKNLINDFTIIEGKDGIDLISNIINDQFNKNRIECIITDENMEFLNGSDAIKIIRSLEISNKIKPTKIASITAFEDQIMKRHLNDIGIDHILHKPCNERDLLKLFNDFGIIRP